MRRDGLVSVVRPGDTPIFPRLTGAARRRAMLHMLFADHGVFRTFFNTRSKISDEMWRSSQPLPYQINGAAKLGIKTIVNLRGDGDNSFYRFEEEFCQRAGITLVNFIINSREAPIRETVLAAKELFAGIEYPALMHCKSGADRAGLMSALYLHFRKGLPVAEAKRQLSLRYGHVRQAKTGILDFFLQSYLDFNARTPMAFEDWVRDVYDREAVTKAFRESWWAGIITDKILRRE
ncbi:MAG: sulfur transferase domain-containing protein [Micropepsaceae bacterium]